jgi:putative SOS response-associated peptidase YedK
MCGRYLTPDQAALERYWNLRAPADFTQSFNVAPSQLAPVVRAGDGGEWSLDLLTWGFQPVWAERSWINARSESVFESRAFASAARKRRCLVPAMGWYEWQGAKAPKQPYIFHRDGFAPFAFAGIWTGRETAEGWLRSFAILTTAATGEMAQIHKRKPVVLDRAQHAAWLDAATGEDEVRVLLGGEFGDVAWYPVSSYVNKPANNDAACIRPLNEDEAESS